jgi:hypothetical protein
LGNASTTSGACPALKCTSFRGATVAGSLGGDGKVPIGEVGKPKAAVIPGGFLAQKAAFLVNDHGGFSHRFAAFRRHHAAGQRSAGQRQLQVTVGGEFQLLAQENLPAGISHR